MRIGGKTQALKKKLEAMGLVYYFEFFDFAHEKEIKEQLVATEGKGKVDKIIWCIGLMNLIKENKNGNK